MIANYEGLELALSGHTATVTLANGPRHAWTEASLSSFIRVLDDLDAHDDVFCLIVTGQGDEFFSGGVDLSRFADGDKDDARDIATRLDAAVERLAAFRGISIAAINGYVVGSGLAFALACDLRIAEEHAAFSLPEVGLGLLPLGGTTQVLPHLVGDAWARRMILCGHRVDAPTALRIGLVEEVVPRGQGAARARDLATRAEAQNPNGVAACKRLAQRALALGAEREEFVRLFDTNDPKEGAGARRWRKR